MTINSTHTSLIDGLRIKLKRINKVRSQVLILYLTPIQAEINALCDKYGLGFSCHTGCAYLTQNAVHNKRAISPSLFNALDSSLCAAIFTRLDGEDKVCDFLEEYKPDSYDITNQFVLTKDTAYIMPSNTPSSTADPTAIIYKDISPALARFLLDYALKHDFEKTCKLFPRTL